MFKKRAISIIILSVILLIACGIYRRTEPVFYAGLGAIIGDDISIIRDAQKDDHNP